MVGDAHGPSIGPSVAEILASHAAGTGSPTKTAARVSQADQLLWRSGRRPTQISKYGTGLAALRPELPSTKWHRILRRHFPAAA